MNLPIYSILTLNFVTQGTCQFIFRFPNIITFQINKNFCPFCQRQKSKKYVLYYQNTIQNDASITNNDDIKSCETARKQNYSIPTISTPNHLTQRIATTSSSVLNFNIRTILPTVGKEYMCFQKDGKTSQDTRCIKSRIMTKAIDWLCSLD